MSVNARPTIVITGVGLVTSLGSSVEECWQGVLQCRDGRGNMPALETASLPDKGGYQAVDLPESFAPDLPREARYLRWALLQALENAGVRNSSPYPPERCGIVLGTTLHGMRAAGRFLRSGDFGELGNFTAGSILHLAAKDLPLAGSAITTCSACSSSLGSVALAMTMLESGEVDLVITGGYDAVSEYAYGGFNSLRLVADGSPRPFARGRTGMNLGEGYATLVLERYEDARKRGVRTIAVIRGCGETADAHHLTQPHPHGAGAAEAIRQALERSAMRPTEIGLIAAHATATPDNDAGEHAAIADVFANANVPVVAFKSHVGHTLGGAGAVELIFSAMALRDQVIPPTVGTGEALEFGDLALNLERCPKPAKIGATLNTSLGFGGANTCAILAPPEVSPALSILTNRRSVYITGIGVILPGIVGIDPFAGAIREGIKPGVVAESDYLHLLNARRVRRMSDYVKLSLASAALACRDAGIDDIGAFDGRCPVLLGSTHGSAAYCTDYYRQIVEDGLLAANPMLFAEGVPNAAAAHLSLMLGLHGACQTVIGTRTAGLDALRLACLRIASGHWERAIVGAAEEFSPLLNDAYRHHGIFGEGDSTKFAATSAAVTYILESEESIADRGGRRRARVDRMAGASFGSGGVVHLLRDVISRIGAPPRVYASANTIESRMGKAESLAIQQCGSGVQAATFADRIPEAFSVGPLLTIAAALSESPESFGVLCTGCTGEIAAASITGC